MTYGDSASTVPERGQRFHPDIVRVFPTRWEEADMGAVEDAEGTIYCNFDGFKQVVRGIKVKDSKGAATDTLMAMERVPDTSYM